MLPSQLRKHGDEVCVYDKRDNFEFSGTIVGVYACDPPIFDVQPRGERSMEKRVCGVPEARLKSMAVAA